MASAEGPHVMSVEEEEQQPTQSNGQPTNEKTVRPTLRSAAADHSLSARSDGGELAVKRTRSRFADEEEAHANGQATKTIVSFSHDDPEDPYNWSTV